MDDVFTPEEKLYRAVYPPEVIEMFWRKDGSVSSAAFADSEGLSVDRGDFRSDSVVTQSMHERFIGRILSLYVKNSTDIGAIVRYLPSKSNIYHSEIHGSDSTPTLSKSQRLFLSKKAVILTK